MVTLKELQDQGEAPTWLEDAGYSTLTKGYLLDEETPKGMYERISKASADRLGHPEYATKFFELFWKNWLCPATPVCTNMGTTRGLPISCFSMAIEDSIQGIMDSAHELAMLTKHGGGVGTYWGDVRPRGSKIGENGISEGIVPFLKIFDSTTVGISQGSTRRGASVAYLPIEHGDFDEFINIRRPQGDVNRQCMNINHAVTIGDDFMQQVVDGDPDARRKWREVLKSRFETGEPYIMFRDAVNRDRPECYKGNDLHVQTSNLCLQGDTEVVVHGPLEFIAGNPSSKITYRKIRDLVHAPVTIYDGKGWIIVQFKQTSDSQALVEVCTTVAGKIQCTPYHRFVLSDGSYVEAQNLEPGMFLREHNFGYQDDDWGGLPGTAKYREHTPCAVVSVHTLNRSEPVFCCTVPTTGQFALSCGIMSGNCSEISLFTDKDHTFVCCLSSMNLARWDEWKDTDAVYWAIHFLDGVMTEFIARAKNIPGFERAVRFSEKSRALGLGVLGWHSYLQNRMVAMDSMEAYLENRIIFKHMREESYRASGDLAKEYGEPEWCRGYGMRNTHTMAIAPTASNSVISGNVSPGIEPLAANAYAHKTAKGTFLQKNRKLMEVLEGYKQNTDEVWKSIVQNEGSVQHLTFLDENEKAVFLTAREINQFVIVKLAAARQSFIDQTQSVNLFFPANTDPGYFNQVHLEAWRSGMHTLYYTRTTSVLKGDAGASYKRDAGECSMCEG